LCLTKISILLFYNRIFGANASFRKWAWALIGVNVVVLLVYDFVLIFQCRPINAAWLRWDGEHEGKCVAGEATAATASAITIGLDIAAIVLPLPQIAKLYLPPRKKIPLYLVFSLGILYVEFGHCATLTGVLADPNSVTIVSGVRIAYIERFVHTQNPTCKLAGTIRSSSVAHADLLNRGLRSDSRLVCHRRLPFSPACLRASDARLCNPRLPLPSRRHFSRNGIEVVRPRC
jgi:hypothetical protein